MPLRDHFRPPLSNRHRWNAFDGMWPAMIVMDLNRKLPDRFVAGPYIRLGGSTEIDVGTFYDEGRPLSEPDFGSHHVLATDLPAQAVYEVRVFDRERGSQLVAVVEFVSPANKDRPEHRRAFVAKCAALLQEQVSVAIVDLVTTRHFNLYSDLLELIGQTDPALPPEPPALYAVACRGTKKDRAWLLETWLHPWSSAKHCRRYRYGWPTIWRCRSNWKRATRRPAAFSVSGDLSGNENAQ